MLKEKGLPLIGTRQGLPIPWLSTAFLFALDFFVSVSVWSEVSNGFWPFWMLVD